MAFEKLGFYNVSHPHENRKPVFSNSSSLKSMIEKLRFCRGLVWTEGLTVGKKLRWARIGGGRAFELPLFRSLPRPLPRPLPALASCSCLSALSLVKE